MALEVMVTDVSGGFVGHIDRDRRAIPARGDFARKMTGRIDGNTVMSGNLIVGWMDGDKIMYMGPGMGGPIQAGRVDGTSIYSCNRVGDEKWIGSTSRVDPIAAAAALILLSWR